MNLERILATIESAANKTAVFVGDTIIDEYQYVSPLGKANKENIIAVKGEWHERFSGGVHAAAAHAASFCKEVHVVSWGPMTRKVRFVDENYNRKLFEVHHWCGEGRKPDEIPESDVTVIADFGHGMIRQDDVDVLCKRKGYIAVCAQTNSANFGFNLITKYPKANYAVVDEPEVRLAARDRTSALAQIMFDISSPRYGKFVVTHGPHGSHGLNNNYKNIYQHQPAFTQRVVDTMGAGDAFFAVTALMAESSYLEDILIIGNAVGALKAQRVGHREPVTKQQLIEFLKDVATSQNNQVGEARVHSR